MTIDQADDIVAPSELGLTAGLQAGSFPDPEMHRDATLQHIGRSIVLVGMMGSGKTSVGLRLARRLGLPFVDADVEIERAANMSVSEIFALEGEDFFRSGERRVIARLLNGPVKVLATGGGAFVDADTRVRIKSQSLSIWLKADLDTLLRRTARRKTRPLLLAGNPRHILEGLIATRHPLYAEAELTVESLPGSPDETAGAVIAALEAHHARQNGSHPGEQI